jgi:hypothetical protein
VTTAGVLALALVTQAANLVWAGPTAGAAADPTFRSLVAADIPDLSGVYQPLNAKLTAFCALANAAGVLTNDGSGVYSWVAASTGTVTSVALTVPSFLNVAGSPVTTSGTFAVTLATQTANTVFAGPGTGLPATPAFRALVAADIPDLSGTYQPLNAKLTAISALANAAGALTNDGAGVFSYVAPTTGTVTSVAMTVPSFLSVAGSPITGSGTLAVTLATETANFVFAGPTTGAAATPTFRALVAADFASIPATTFTMATARILGRTTAGTGVVEELTAGTSLSLSAGSLNTIQDIRTSASPTFTGIFAGNVETVGNQIFEYATNATTSLATQFRDFSVYDGKNNFVFGSVGSTKAATFAGPITTTQIYPGNFLLTGNQILEFTTNATSSIAINFSGYAAGTTQFRDFSVFDGKNNSVFSLVGSTRAATFTGAVTATTYSAAVAAGGTMVTLNASTGTANTGGSIVFQRGASNKWSIGTGISIGSDAFEIYDRVNSLSLFSMVLATGNVTLAGNVTTGGIITATGAAAGMAITVPAGGGGLVLNAGTGTANTGMNLTWQRGASSKWNLGTGISLGADAFELYDRANGVSAFSVATSTSALTIRSSLTTGNPSGGTALPIKFGSYVAGAPAATGYQQIEINGTAYKLLCST